MLQAFLEVVDELLLVPPQRDAHVLDLRVVDVWSPWPTFEDWRQLQESPVPALTRERLDLDAVVGLLLEVLLHIVNDDDFGQIATQNAQVFDPVIAFLSNVIAVQPVLDHLLVVDAVENVVGVLLSKRLPP